LGSIARLGRIDVTTLPAKDVAHSRLLGALDVIQVSGARCFVCHSYFVSDPRVSSDLIALLRVKAQRARPAADRSREAFLARADGRRVGPCAVKRASGHVR
jgi:Alpha/beta hydrolase of unknown function (DUF900)